MEALYTTKREVASLIPYRFRGGEYEFFLQKRSADARINPGLLGVFGGGLEGEETPEEGMLREVAEELSYAPIQHQYLSRYETNTSVLHAFIEEVPTDFESRVTVGEGEYGVFLKAEDILHVKDVTLLAQMVIHHMIRDVLPKYETLTRS